ncbi:MAG: DMT family transporter [Bacteroidales bacterium]|nr:DMT family transporter [Bacteroidales bacterium]
MPKRSFYSTSIFLAVLACILWSTAFVGIKIGLRYSGPLQFAGIRFMISGLIILPFCTNIKNDMILLKKNIRKIFLISLFQTVLLYGFFYTGMDKTPAAIGAIIVGGGPLFVAVLAHFITGKDPLTLRKSLALIIGFGGIILIAIVKDKTVENHTTVVTGILLLITGNLAGSYGNILISKTKTGISPLFTNAIQIFAGGFILLILSFLIEGFEFGAKPFEYYLSLGWLSFISAVAFSVWFVVLSRPEIKVSEINVWKFMIPMLGAILSWIIIKNERPQLNTIVGMIFIAASILIIFGRKQNKSIR